MACCPSCECGSSLIELGKRIGYSDEDLRNVPEASNMGLECGNPVALAALKDGDTVLDLGSGGGIDVFLVAKRVGHKGKVFREAYRVLKPSGKIMISDLVTEGDYQRK